MNQNYWKKNAGIQQENALTRVRITTQHTHTHTHIERERERDRQNSLTFPQTHYGNTGSYSLPVSSIHLSSIQAVSD